MAQKLDVANHGAAIQREMRKQNERILDEIGAKQAAKDAQRALEKLAKFMGDTDYATYGGYCGLCKRNGVSPVDASKMLLNVQKMVDELVRLLNYDKGEADRITEVKGLDSLLPLLKPEQFDLVSQWLEENEPASH